MAIGRLLLATGFLASALLVFAATAFAEDPPQAETDETLTVEAVSAWLLKEASPQERWQVLATLLQMLTASDGSLHWVLQQGKSDGVESDETSPPAVSQEGEAGPANFGEWRFFTAANADGDLVGYSLEGESSDHYSWDSPPSLYLRCSSSGNRSAYITTAELLFNDYDTDTMTVTHRVTGGISRTGQWWSDEESDSALFATDSFVSWLRTEYDVGDVLYVAASDDYDNYAASFPLTGLASVLSALRCW